MIIFLFGLPGVGKTYIGKLIQKELGVCYWDGDEVLTAEMKEAVFKEQPFSPAMTAALTDSIISRITELQSKHSVVVVSQAMLREIDRQTFRNNFSEIQFIYIDCTYEVASQRIAQRADFVTVSYFEKLIDKFKPHRPDAETYPCINNFDKTDQQLLEEFKGIIKNHPKISLKSSLFAGHRVCSDTSVERDDKINPYP